MKRPALLAAVCLLILSVWEIAVLLRARASAPGDVDWQRARTAVEAAVQPGDLIVFAPAWVDPVGRKWLGHLMTIDQAARMDAARYSRLWEVSIRGARAPETAGAGPPVFDASFGAVHVRQFVRPARQVLWDLHDRARLLEVDYQPRRCVPLAPGGRLDAGAVPLGRELHVYAGLADFRSRRDNRAFALVKVFVDEQEVTQASVGNDSGWLALPVAETGPGTHHVTFAATIDPTRGDPRHAHLDLCIAAEAAQ